VYTVAPKWSGINNTHYHNMPLYEFRCPACGIFDEWRSMIDRSQPAICPSCQQSANRIMSIPGIQLNGAIRLKKGENPEPKLVKKPEFDPEKRPRPQSHGGRPWMINH
jgi:putative FmdB family regulatory protein